MSDDPGNFTSTTVGIGKRGPARAALGRGACVDRYIIVDEIGQGGMGVVYKAFDPELGRPVALKLLRTRSGASDVLRGRLLREAQALARLAHPNVIAVHDVGTVADDVFIAMEFVDGVTLRHWLRESARSQRAILDTFLAAGEGLSAAHRAGLVHRDFKPDNVIVGADGRVRVLDFGLARSASSDDEGAAPAAPASTEAAASPPSAVRARDDAADANRSVESPSVDHLRPALTRAGMVMGTPRFMAPEQRNGLTVDERADQFSFSLSLYEAIEGCSPFGASLTEIETNISDGMVPDLTSSKRTPRWLQKVLLRGLMPRAEQRYASMDELLVALRADPRQARRDRGRVLVPLALAALALVGWRLVQRREVHACAGAEAKLAGIWDAPRREAIRAAFHRSDKSYAATALSTIERVFDDYTKTWVKTHVDACEATNVRREQSQEMLDLRMTCLSDRLLQLKTLSDLYATADAGIVEQAAQSAQSIPSLDLCSDAAALRAPMLPPRDATTQHRVDAVRASLARASALDLAARYEDGLSVTKAALADAAKLGYAPVTAEAELRFGLLLGGHGDYAEASNALHRAFVAALEGHHDEAAAAAATSLIQAVGERQAHYDDADRWAAVSEALLGRLQHKDELLGALYTNRSLLRERESKYDEALRDAQLALELKQRMLGPEHYSVAITQHQLGNVHEARAEYAEALASYQSAYAIERKTLGSEHPLLIKSLVGMADVYGESGQHERALAMYERALVDLRRIRADHPSLPMVYNNMGEELRVLGRSAEAMERFQSAFESWQKQLGPSFETTVALNNIAETDLELDQPAQALTHFLRAQQMCEQTLGARHSWCGTNLAGLGEAYRRLGKSEPALDSFRQALTILEAAHGPKNMKLVPALLGMGHTLGASHAGAAATAPLERALAICEAEPGDGIALANVRLALAETLAPSERTRARTLAEEARAQFQKSGARQRKSLAEADVWLGHHR
jgi:eukaryotic-like serine/threonine-protein kinase